MGLRLAGQVLLEAHPQDDPRYAQALDAAGASLGLTVALRGANLLLGRKFG